MDDLTPSDAERRTAAFCKHLTALRGEYGLSIGAISRRCGLEYGHCSRLERGARNPGRATLDKIAAGLGLDRERHDALLLAAGFVPNDLPTDLLLAAVAEARTARGVAA